MRQPSNILEYRIYRGAGSVAAIDYSAPIETVPVTGDPASVRLDLLAVNWAAGETWFIAIRSVNTAGVEFADPAAIVRAEFDDAGRLLPQCPSQVCDLSAQPTAGQRLAVAWRYAARTGSPAPTQFHVFLAPGTTTVEQMLAGQPAATLSAPAGRLTIDYTYGWASSVLDCGPWRAVVRAVTASTSGIAAGPAGDVVGWVRPSRAVHVHILAAEVR